MEVTEIFYTSWSFKVTFIVFIYSKSRTIVFWSTPVLAWSVVSWHVTMHNKQMFTIETCLALNGKICCKRCCPVIKKNVLISSGLKFYNWKNFSICVKLLIPWREGIIIIFVENLGSLCLAIPASFDIFSLQDHQVFAIRESLTIAYDSVHPCGLNYTYLATQCMNNYQKTVVTPWESKLCTLADCDNSIKRVLLVTYVISILYC